MSAQQAPLLLAVFNEFAHPEVLEKVKEAGICEVDVAAKPRDLVAPEPETDPAKMEKHAAKVAAYESERRILRTNAKLITMPYHISSMRDPFESLTMEAHEALQQHVEKTVRQLEQLGFRRDERVPITGQSHPDRVILFFEE